ncbi:hypothetical protein RB9784 [Rhodopirellula baltica SH 1]|uniref:Uncharacterized protein n=1 Tax=Rhodopirellula baltica (strain DSM 10527 / NCIMB 13988 / SH1) TaxID=243090 RepID=Q7UL26_RHOBA|nr:hypothetical protein RB9784 [Rhodopirellula baltica SH 1]
MDAAICDRRFPFRLNPPRQHDQSRTFVSNVPSSPVLLRAPANRRHHATQKTDIFFIRSRIRQEFGPHLSPLRGLEDAVLQPRPRVENPRLATVTAPRLLDLADANDQSRSDGSREPWVFNPRSSAYHTRASSRGATTVVRRVNKATPYQLDLFFPALSNSYPSQFQFGWSLPAEVPMTKQGDSFKSNASSICPPTCSRHGSSR